MTPSPAFRPDLLSADCEAVWQAYGYVPLADLFRSLAGKLPSDQLQRGAHILCAAYNGADANRKSLRAAAQAGHEAAADTEAWMQIQGISEPPGYPIPYSRAEPLHRMLLADPAGFIAEGTQPYPAFMEDQHRGFDPIWVRERLSSSQTRLRRMAEARNHDTAVLVGNGPSLNRSDLSLLDGQDIYLSNYAIRHPKLGPQARGLAVTNHLVAAQEPYIFHPEVRPAPQWRVYPVWLGHILPDSAHTIWLNALGGEMFFSRQPEKTVAWHATVSYFWLQILFGLGYRKVVMIGFDHSYTQPSGLSEGTVLHQEGADPNHFDASYFSGKKWQSADVDHMARGYALAQQHYAADGREIVNCTEGGALNIFRRGKLADELPRA